MPFGDGPEAALRDYITRFRGAAPGCLFLATRGARRSLAPFALTTLFDRLGRRAGVDHAHAHRFRHTFATWAIENHARELDVQYLLGPLDLGDGCVAIPPPTMPRKRPTRMPRSAPRRGCWRGRNGTG